MRSFMVFLKKEVLEQFRTKRFLVLLCVFAALGVTSPILARYMQEIINMAAGNIALQMPEPTWIDSWGQFYSNLTQLGALVVIVLYMGSISEEKKSGSAALTLTKNLSHGKFVSAKFLSASVFTTASFLLAIIINYSYTHFLFGEAGNVGRVISSSASYLVALIALIAVITLASALTKSSLASAMISFAGYISFTILQNIPVVRYISPGLLMGQAVGLLGGQEFSAVPVFGTLCLVAVCVVGAVMSLKKQEI